MTLIGNRYVQRADFAREKLDAHGSLHDFSRETFMQRKLNVACATLCKCIITLALVYSVYKLVDVKHGQKSYLLRKSWRFRSQVLKPVCRKEL